MKHNRRSAGFGLLRRCSLRNRNGLWFVFVFVFGASSWLLFGNVAGSLLGFVEPLLDSAQPLMLLNREPNEDEHYQPKEHRMGLPFYPLA